MRIAILQVFKDFNGRNYKLGENENLRIFFSISQENLL
jgi:hypothetical protein